MEIVKKEKKYIVQGDGDGWVFNKTFPTKWKAEIAMEVYKEGGNIQEYWRRKKFREENPIRRRPTKAIKILEKALDEILQLNPTCDEIVAFSKVSGHWTHSNNDRYFSPRLHDSWGVKLGGRVHIDLGCAGIHLMLTKESASVFINFIKDNRDVK